MIDTMRAEKRPDGTIAAYRSDWNTHIADQIGSVRCREATLWHYTAVLRALAGAGASEAVVRNVARTLGAIRKFGFRHGYFVDENTFGAAQQRRDLVADYRRLARIARADEGGPISLDVCPSVDDVAVYAAAFKTEYPGYGARLVWLAFATGLRICELLALKWDSINLETIRRRGASRGRPGCGPPTPTSRPASSPTHSTGTARTTAGCSPGTGRS
jgi:integrase